MKDPFIRANIKQKLRIKIQQINADIFSSQVLLKLIDYFFYFIKIKMTVLKDLELKDVIYEKA